MKTAEELQKEYDKVYREWLPHWNEGNRLHKIMVRLEDEIEMALKREAGK